MSRKAVRVALALILLLALNAGAAAEKIKLQFSMWIDGANPGEVAAQQALLDQYNQLNPHVEVELYYQGWSGYHDKLLTMAVGGIAPDIMALSRLHVPNFAMQGIIQPIDPWFDQESEEFMSNIFETVSGTYDGKLYGIPIWGGPTVAQYNADLFDLAGLAQPAHLAQQGEWTWDMFVDAGKKITRDTNGDGIYDGFMHARLGSRAADWYIKVRSFGGDIITPDGRPVTDVGALERGLEFFASIAHEHHIAPVGSESSNFSAGTEAVYFSWVSDIPVNYARAAGKFDFEIAPPPKGPAGQYTVVGGVPLVISSNTPHAEEAYKFARWYAMESSAWEIRGMPSNLEHLATEYHAYLSTMVDWPEAVMMAMSGAYSMEPGVGPHFNQLNSAWNPTIAAVANGTMAPREGAIRLIQSTMQITGQ